VADDTFWKMEERLWTGGVAAYEERLDADCIMAFPPPAGLMKREAIFASISKARRWTAVEMTGRHTSHPRDSVAVLGYRARARRGEETYEAVCTSVYVLRDGGWRMVQHQQTPLTSKG
jgi:Domain of unknown function (DUF4440)